MTTAPFSIILGPVLQLPVSLPRYYVTNPWGTSLTTSQRKRTLDIPNETAHLADRSRGLDSSQAPLSGAEPCRAQSPTGGLCSTAARDTDEDGTWFRWWVQADVTFSEVMLAWHRRLREWVKNEWNLDGDVGVGVSPVEDGSEVELWVSLCCKNPRPDGFVLTAHYGVNIWSCGT